MASRLSRIFYASAYQMSRSISYVNYFNKVSPKSVPIVSGKFQYFAAPRFLSQQTEHMIVEYDHVKKATSDDKVYIIDVREPEEVKEHGKIPNSVNIPLGSVSTVLGPMSDKEFEKTYNRSKPSEDAEIIFYCMIGKRSGMAQQNALNLGYKK
ncbi:unnamed protein product [Danaus chrysippus]|uniref:(African queen) hypothetical protein n=1 Tax=Danaus chrysippus TaxID=151541 RepID=A0A8J2VYK5_9NEOP|nr:unnamed protein product [Danaus chrysippus]